MRKKIALKRLSASDLTFFHTHFKNSAGTKQKALNLDRSVFVDHFFPSLPEKDDAGWKKFPVDVSFFGPATATLHNVQRKILKQQKNWRLDGELVYDPEDDEGRYSRLQKDDFAIMEFVGDFEPTAVRIFLVDRYSENNQELHEILAQRFGNLLTPRQGMSVVAEEELQAALSEIEIPSDHPLVDFLDTAELEDAIQRGIRGQRNLQKRRQRRGVSPAEFMRARAKMEATGVQGEELVDFFLADQLDQGEIAHYKWVASENAIAPFDFEIGLKDQLRRLDVKATAGPFANVLHISLAELLEIANGPHPYDIYRLYEVKEFNAKARVARDLRDLAKEWLVNLAGLPDHVTVDSISVMPEAMSFAEEFEISITD